MSEERLTPQSNAMDEKELRPDSKSPSAPISISSGDQVVAAVEGKYKISLPGTTSAHVIPA